MKQQPYTSENKPEQR